MKTVPVTLFFALALNIVILFACSQSPPPKKNTTAPKPPTPPARTSDSNPLLEPWKGPYGGVPPFGKVKLAHFEPALEKAMAGTLEKLENIGRSTEPATFENTITAMERAMLPLRRVQAVYGVWRGAKQTPGFQKLQRKMAPKLAAFGDKITQNEALFKRIRAVYEKRDKTALSHEQKRLVRETYLEFVRSGAELDEKAKQQLSEINQALAGLYTRFGQNVLSDENTQRLVLETEADLAGLPPSFRQSAKAKAQSLDMPEKWVISNTRSSVDPFLTYSKRRDLREKAWRMFVNRGDRGGKTDNNAIITEILALRAKRAKLLGYATHAHWRLQNTMAKTPEAVLELLMAVWKPAVARVHKEVAAMQAIADKENEKIRIQPWDYHFYAEKVRKQKYNLDESQLKPYLQLSKLQAATFYVAEKLFGYRFKPLKEIPRFDDDVRVFAVFRSKGGQSGKNEEIEGLFYFDPWARANKRSGAWMSAYRSQHKLAGEVLPIVSNNTNFLEGQPGQPVLISWDDARTLFHEFGHALHGLCSDVTYPSLAGTSVYRDYVEFPSQFIENLVAVPDVLKRFALHHKTGKPIPPSLIKRLKKASTFKQGFKTVEYLASAIVDMKLHLAGSKKIDPDAFEKKTLKELGMPKEIVMRHRTPHFLHIFASDSYSAGYYSYLWSDVLSADALEAFAEAGGPFDPEMAKRLYKYVFSAGNTIEPSVGYKRFRGRGPRVDALMRKRGFAKSKQ